VFVKSGIWGLILLFMATPLPARETLFHFPVGCHPNHDCYIFHYVDHDPTSGFQDFAGGRMTSDGHKGTDIAVATYEKMRQKIPVLAAADGVVKSTRDGERDRYRNDGAVTPPGKECGNGVAITHRENYRTHYCHMMKDSVCVVPGQEVHAGQRIGFLGSSGRADFPHLHFAIYHKDQVMDPFASQLWTPPIQYKPYGLIDMGLHHNPLTVREVLDIPPRRHTFSCQDPAMAAWVRVFGVLKGDRERFIFYRNNGEIYRTPMEKTLKKSFKEWFSFSGYRLQSESCPALKGKWRVVYELKRSGDEWEVLGSRTFTLGLSAP